MLDYETLRLIWWLLIGIILVAFMVTDGFDMGVGCLLPLIARNDDERRENAADRRDERTRDSRHADADKGRGVDRNRTRRHLRNGHQVGKLAHVQPVIVFDRLGLNHRHGSITAAYTEHSYLQKAEKKL